MIGEKGRGKRPREQLQKGQSSISPPKKRVTKNTRKRANKLQPPISDWLTDDEQPVSQDQQEPCNASTGEESNSGIPSMTSPEC